MEKEQVKEARFDAQSVRATATVRAIATVPAAESVPAVAPVGTAQRRRTRGRVRRRVLRRPVL
ncbi:hypothetical protein STRIP9103_05031 [Streptomyces ipomoeae 91-03]|uniref:Uncharacterized protein n=1 Tax=Streptomyces ipomoeae 91-03 TaxID=698759 RepID=L1L8Z5_9ACTN|nr:hypothetical protein STRIP9103_05031 [Streptomyces ipomoeae 91-03]